MSLYFSISTDKSNSMDPDFYLFYVAYGHIDPSIVIVLQKQLHIYQIQICSQLLD